MERTERYDPEDLEQMMLERSFDELLEEERAFALRHLESRAEYERMRILLHHMQQSAGNTPALEADPRVREHVLAAFRAQQQPQWRIWLNSVGGFLLPQRPALYWRPALALGAVVALTITVLRTYRAFEDGSNTQLAEVKTVQPAPPAPARQAERSEPAGSPEATSTGAASAAGVKTKAPDEPAHQLAETKAVAPAQASASEAVAESKALEQPVQSASTTQATAASGIAAFPSAKNEMTNTEPASPSTATSADMAEARNKEAEETASRKRAAYTEKTADKATASVYSEDDLLGLLQAAW
jgi:hypothetical protein